MRKVLLSPAVALLFALTVCGQTGQCSLKLAELPATPELFGFRMGMTTEQVKAHVPQVVFPRPDEFTVVKTTINPDFDPRINKAEFQGVRSISLDFLDDKLTSLWFGFDATFKWQTVDEFADGISKSLRLPNAWSPWRTRGKKMQCGDFQVTVTIVGEGPSFRILDETAESTLVARRQAKEEQEAALAEGADEIVADRQTKIYYAAGCQPANEIKDENRVVFASVEDAAKAGYKPSKDCQ